MGVALTLLRLFLVICTLKSTAENPIPTYRFKVYPVVECPMTPKEFEIAAERRNCTGHSRYLCAPDKYLSNLIEFCTDARRSLFREGNCLRLEGTGGLNHYRCVDNFTTGCPTEPYYDEEIYRYPACLEINVDDKCFVADKHCPERKKDSRNGKKDPKRPSKSHAAIVYIFLVILVVAGICLGFYLKRRKENGLGGKTTQKDGTQLGDIGETGTLLYGTKEDQPQNVEINTKKGEEFPSNREESETSSVDTENSTVIKAETVPLEATTTRGKTTQKDGTQLGDIGETGTLLYGSKKDRPQNDEINTKKGEEFPSNGEKSETSSVDTENSTVIKAETEATTTTGSIDAKDTGKGNKFFLRGIIEGPLTDLMRDILTKEVPLQSLLQKAKDLAEAQKNKKSLIKKEQEKFINEGQYTKFDISLLYVLIRNCTNIPQHANRWGNIPSAGDKSVSANIERIRLIRNKYAHVDTVHVSDTEYDHRWQEIFNIVQGLENYLDTPFSYQDILKAFKINSMDQNQSERFIELFLVFYKTQKELFEKVMQKLQDTHNTKEKESQKSLEELRKQEEIAKLKEEREFEVLALKKEVLTLQKQILTLQKQTIQTSFPVVFSLPE